jgi:hypothetical protein
MVILRELFIQRNNEKLIHTIYIHRVKTTYSTNCTTCANFKRERVSITLPTVSIFFTIVSAIIYFSAGVEGNAKLKRSNHGNITPDSWV